MLIRSISGIRGLVNEDLGEKTIIKYAHALHDYLQDGVIYVGRDSRPSGEEIVQIMINELIKLGRTIMYCGIVPTPTIQYMVHTTDKNKTQRMFGVFLYVIGTLFLIRFLDL